MVTDLRAAVATRRSPNAVVAVTVGLVYLSVGVVALAVRVGRAMATAGPASDVGLLTLSVHLAFGWVLVLATAAGWAKLSNTVVGASYLLVGLALESLPDVGPGLLTLNDPENVVHLATAALLFGFGRTQD